MMCAILNNLSARAVLDCTDEELGAWSIVYPEIPDIYTIAGRHFTIFRNGSTDKEIGASLKASYSYV